MQTGNEGSSASNLLLSLGPSRFGPILGGAVRFTRLHADLAGQRLHAFVEPYRFIHSAAFAGLSQAS
jgi:hypothetical protein